jgi:hypothetical protein
MPAVLRGGEGRIRTSEGVRRQIYSLLPLAAREPLLTYNLVADLRFGKLRTLARRLPALRPADSRLFYLNYCIIALNTLSRWRESNSQPTDYKSVALPLSYIGPTLETF